MLGKIWDLCKLKDVIHNMKLAQFWGAKQSKQSNKSLKISIV